MTNCIFIYFYIFYYEFQCFNFIFLAVFFFSLLEVFNQCCNNFKFLFQDLPENHISEWSLLYKDYYYYYHSSETTNIVWKLYFPVLQSLFNKVRIYMNAVCSDSITQTVVSYNNLSFSKDELDLTTGEGVLQFSIVSCCNGLSSLSLGNISKSASSLSSCLKKYAWRATSYKFVDNCLLVCSTICENRLSSFWSRRYGSSNSTSFPSSNTCD